MRAPSRGARRLDRHGWLPAEHRLDHPERRRLRESAARFKWLAAGRRSGKTEDSIGHVLLGHGPIDSLGMPRFRGVLTASDMIEDPSYVIAGPTYSMLRKIWWDKIKRRVPRDFVHSVSEQFMEIRYINGAILRLLGMDTPTRSEGIPIDGLVVDEFAYVKENAWKRSLRPALSNRNRPPGWAILQGKPAGRNHFYKSHRRAALGKWASHESFHWTSSVILSPLEIAQARVDMDSQSFRQEYEASFESFSGLAYWAFSDANYRTIEFDPNRPLAFAWDFGTSPGTVAVCQIHDLPATHCLICGDPKPSGVDAGMSWHCHLCGEVAYAFIPSLMVIGEVYRAVGATTRMLCEDLVANWAGRVKPHAPLFLYGDPSGFGSSTRSISSDWDEIQTVLRRHFSDVRMNVPAQQPEQRPRVNALLRLCCGDTGLRRLFVDPDKAPHVGEDFENTTQKEDGSGQLDKKAAGGMYSHMTDALGYLALREFPAREEEVAAEVVGT